MKTKAKIIAFKLSMLTTLMLCVSVNNASDIEIYKAPNAADGKARVMLNLDNSTFMSGDPSGMKGGPSTIVDDFKGVDCPNGSQKYHIETETRSYSWNSKSYSYKALYCEIKVADINNNGEANANRILNLCPLNTSGNARKCYSRLTMLKRSALDVINDQNLGSGVKIGLSFFPKHDGQKRIEAGRLDGTNTVTRPVPLAWYNPTTGAICEISPYKDCIDGRDQLSRIIAGVDISETNFDEKEVPVAKGYGDAAHGLLTNPDGTDLRADQCSGYGIFTLTSGIPDSDDAGEARIKLNSILRAETDSTILNVTGQCPTSGGDGGSASDGFSWKCVNTAAERLLAGKAKIAMPVKSVVVSYGSSFTLGKPDLNPYDAKLTTQQTINADILASAEKDGQLLNDKRYAAYSGLNGGGGYYSVQDPNALSDKIIEFIKNVGKVDIPFMTTGAPTIPQDPLNPILVQSNAYFAQFKPTPLRVPTEGSSLWVGNMKKYHVNSLGRLVGKNSDVIGAAEEKEAVTDSLGRLITGTHDYWAPNVSSNPDIAKDNETVWGSELYARMGGVKSQLLLGLSEDGKVENRKLLTNRVIDSETGAATNGSTLIPVKRSNWAVNDPKRSDLLTLLDLRQLGAVMHSSPLLLSNEGKMTYDEEAKKFVTSGREDYVLFGSVQGVLHVVKADDYTTSNGGGKEVFAFVPNEMVERQSKAFLTPDQSTGGTANLFYGIDAPWVAYTEYVPKADGTLTVGTGKVTTGSAMLNGKQMVYGGLRMGGRSYYALDLKNMNDPRLKFHINPDAATTGPLSYMGESWSKPKLAWVKWQGSRKLVMFVGGGYDAGGTNGIGSKANNAGYESDTYDQTNGIGAGVYMFSADGEDAGDLLWWASNNVDATTNSLTNSGIIALKDSNMKYSVASEIKTADRNNDGLVDHLYFGDLGGQVFRVDLNNNANTSGAFATRSTRILNMHVSNGKSPRFYSAPSFAIFDDKASGNLFAAISIGSGNLSHPLAAYDSGRNYDAIYTIYDKDVTRADLYTASSMNTIDTSVGNNNSVLALNEISMSNRFQQNATQMSALIAPYASSAGWYYKLVGGTKIQQEKIFFSPTAIDYDLYVSSYDSSRLGLTGECGGGVQGVSKVQVFCMPFGQCSASEYSTRTDNNYSDDHGPGIQNHAIASGGDGTTRLVGGTLTTNNLNTTYATRVKLIAQRWYER